MKVYISAPISGRVYEDIVSSFSIAEYCIKHSEHESVNPLRNGLDIKSLWQDHMIRDLELLRGCDAIVMLDGWGNSTGCQIEKLFAEKLGLIVFMGLDELQRASHDAERK